MDLEPFCPRYHHAVELLGRRWSGGIVRAMLAGQSRFSELKTAIPGLSDRLLSERLKELEAEGVVVRTVIADKPVRVEYELTDKGRDLAGAVAAISAWADKWIEPPDPSWRPAGASPPVEQAEPATTTRRRRAAGSARKR